MTNVQMIFVFIVLFFVCFLISKLHHYNGRANAGRTLCRKNIFESENAGAGLSACDDNKTGTTTRSADL
jgi:hypothetical protein